MAQIDTPCTPEFLIAGMKLLRISFTTMNQKKILTSSTLMDRQSAKVKQPLPTHQFPEIETDENETTYQRLSTTSTPDTTMTTSSSLQVSGGCFQARHAKQYMKRVSEEHAYDKVTGFSSNFQSSLAERSPRVNEG